MSVVIPFREQIVLSEDDFAICEDYASRWINSDRGASYCDRGQWDPGKKKKDQRLGKRGEFAVARILGCSLPDTTIHGIGDRRHGVDLPDVNLNVKTVAYGSQVGLSEAFMFEKSDPHLSDSDLWAFAVMLDHRTRVFDVIVNIAASFFTGMFVPPERNLPTKHALLRRHLWSAFEVQYPNNGKKHVSA